MVITMGLDSVHAGNDTKVSMKFTLLVRGIEDYLVDLLRAEGKRQSVLAAIQPAVYLRPVV